MNSSKSYVQSVSAVLFLTLAIVGLYYVKWSPYYNRAFTAAATHSIGHSILMGKGASPPTPSFQAAASYAMAYGKAVWQAVILGLLLGSAVQVLLPSDWIIKLLGRVGLPSVITGSLLALPSMMCTCCAAPVVVGMRAGRASAGSAIAFWLGNSVLNPATLVFIGFVLGWHWAAVRLLLGLLMVVGLAYLANRLNTAHDDLGEVRVAEISSSLKYGPTDLLMRWVKIFSRMALFLLPEYIILIFLLGLVRAWLFPVIGAGIDNHLVWIVAFAVSGLIFAVPTAAEVPIIQGMLSLGMGVGPAGALLITLPPISVPSLAMVVGSFPIRVLGLLIVGVLGFGILGGLIAASLGP